MIYIFQPKALEEAGKQLGVNIEMIHKKINLKEDLQSWEHEKYSMRKITAFTLSRLSVSLFYYIMVKILCKWNSFFVLLVFMSKKMLIFSHNGFKIYSEIKLNFTPYHINISFISV